MPVRNKTIKFVQQSLIESIYRIFKFIRQQRVVGLCLWLWLWCRLLRPVLLLCCCCCGFAALMLLLLVLNLRLRCAARFSQSSRISSYMMAFSFDSCLLDFEEPFDTLGFAGFTRNLLILNYKFISINCVSKTLFSNQIYKSCKTLLRDKGLCFVEDSQVGVSELHATRMTNSGRCY